MVLLGGGAELYFPEAEWDGAQVRFEPAAEPPSPGEPFFAAIVFAWLGERVCVANIRGRGWCVPGGRREAGETPEETVRREAREEAAIRLEGLRPVGRFLVCRAGEGARRVILFSASVAGQGDLGPGSEATAVAYMSLAELASRYYFWDPLLEAVFQWGLQQRLQSGYPPAPGGANPGPTEGGLNPPSE